MTTLAQARLELEAQPLALALPSSLNHNQWSELGVDERFWEKVDQLDEESCWAWLAYCRKDGYGQFAYIAYGKKKMIKSHLMAYRLIRGDAPSGYQVDHTCHDPEFCLGGDGCPHRKCCNPDHLKAVSPRENALRSNSPTALNAKKTRCAQGHPFSGDNLYVAPNGRRKCRICEKRWATAGNRKRREASHA